MDTNSITHVFVVRHGFYQFLNGVFSSKEYALKFIALKLKNWNIDPTYEEIPEGETKSFGDGNIYSNNNYYVTCVKLNEELK